MQETTNRRGFIGTAGAAGAALAALPARVFPAAEAVTSSTPAAEKLGWRVGCQLYTFRRFAFYEALEKIASLGVGYVEPCFFLRLCTQRPKLKTNESLAPEIRAVLKEKLAARGVTMPNFYARLGNNKEACRKTFAFAADMGVETIVAEPPAAAFDMIETLCDEYRINLAVHNHPKSPKSKYWKPENVLAVCRGRGKRIGACVDTGHWIRSGLNPVACLGKMKGRIITVHLKDVVESGNPKARDVPLGTGRGDYAAVLRELRDQGFKGVMSVEYEHDSPKLMAEVKACIAFVEKTARSL